MSPTQTAERHRRIVRRCAHRKPPRHATARWRQALLRHPQWWGALLSALVTAALLSAV